jgi:ABC-type sugar transport system substrate-binding protein
MKKKKKYLLVLTAVVVFASLLVGTSVFGRPKEDEEAIRIGVAWATLDIEFFQLYQRGAREKAEELGVELIEYDSNYDPEKEISNIENLLAQDLDALIVHPVDETTIVPMVEEANRRGIPVFALDRKPRGGEFAYLSAGHEQIGKLQAEFLVEQIGGKGKVAYIGGMEGESYVTMLAEKADEVFEKYPDIEIVFRQHADWDRGIGMRVTEDLLTAYPDIDAIRYDADMMAMGGWEAIKAAGKQDQIAIVAGDADLDMLQAIKRGEIAGTIDPKPVEGAMMAVQGAYELATKGEMSGAKTIDGIPTIFLTVQVITKENVDTTKAWGVVPID